MARCKSAGPILAGILCLLATTAFAQQQAAPGQGSVTKEELAQNFQAEKPGGLPRHWQALVLMIGTHSATHIRNVTRMVHERDPTPFTSSVAMSHTH